MNLAAGAVMPSFPSTDNSTSDTTNLGAPVEQGHDGDTALTSLMDVERRHGNFNAVIKKAIADNYWFCVLHKQINAIERVVGVSTRNISVFHSTAISGFDQHLQNSELFDLDVFTAAYKPVLNIQSILAQFIVVGFLTACPNLGALHQEKIWLPYIKLAINCPHSSCFSTAEIITEICPRLLMDYLTEYAYAAQVSGIFYGIHHTESGHQVPMTSCQLLSVPIEPHLGRSLGVAGVPEIGFIYTALVKAVTSTATTACGVVEDMQSDPRAAEYAQKSEGTLEKLGQTTVLMNV
ncbi:uncharacterized protein [Aristolochia californica]|uniref:uncharacterized protein n=1 Tax=Aristolochia californica TaxID=171875 RepID=UPI0035DBA5B3